MLKINNYTDYYEATFIGGNLYAFNIGNLITQLVTIYGFKLDTIYKVLFSGENIKTI